MRFKTVRSDSFTYMYDQNLFPDIPKALFESECAQAGESSEPVGRGSARILVHEGVSLVHKRYERGGYPRRIIRDSYAYLGLQRTRMWREFSLLLRLKELGLPVPDPAAARCERNTLLSYRGELITVCLVDARTLMEVLEETPLSSETWAAIGRVIARFHKADVFHADLNARNIMLDRSGGIFLIDFDKCAIRPGNKKWWAPANLERLARSLRKGKRLSKQLHFSEENWASLNRGYQS